MKILQEILQVLANMTPSINQTLIDDINGAIIQYNSKYNSNITTVQGNISMYLVTKAKAMEDIMKFQQSLIDSNMEDPEVVARAEREREAAEEVTPEPIENTQIQKDIVDLQDLLDSTVPGSILEMNEHYQDQSYTILSRIVIESQRDMSIQITVQNTEDVGDVLIVSAVDFLEDVDSILEEPLEVPERNI